MAPFIISVVLVVGLSIAFALFSSELLPYLERRRLEKRAYKLEKLRLKNQQKEGSNDSTGSDVQDR